MREVVLPRLVSASIAIGALFLAWAVEGDAMLGYPLVNIRQGVTVVTIDGRSVFAIRDGAALRFLGRTVPSTGARIVYCPKEGFFVGPGDFSLFDREGRYVDGPVAGDMDRVRHRTDQVELQVYLGEVEERRRSIGEISEDSAAAYRAWREAPDTPQRFCQDEIG